MVSDGRGHATEVKKREGEFPAEICREGDEFLSPREGPSLSPQAPAVANCGAVIITPQIKKK